LPRTIAARSEAEAIREYLEPFQQAIAAFAANVVFVQTRPDPYTRIRRLTVANDDVVLLQDVDGEIQLALGIELAFRAVQLPSPPKRWTVETTKYIYHLEEPTIPVRELVGYHWHPEVPGISFPHIHMYAAEGSARRMHVATPYSTLNEALATAMRDYDVTPLSQHLDVSEGLLQAADETLQTSMRWARVR